MLVRAVKLISKSVFSTKFLFYANLGISLTLSGLGDILEQQYEMMSNELQSWDTTRTKNMALAGSTSGIVCHYWYHYLDNKIPGQTVKAVTKKVLADQVICSPITISLFFITLSILECKTFNDFKEEFRRKAWRLYVAEWVVWPSAQFVNFYILPLKYRVLYDNTVSLGYDVYTSYVVKRNPNKMKLDSIDNDKLK